MTITIIYCKFIDIFTYNYKTKWQVKFIHSFYFIHSFILLRFEIEVDYQYEYH